MEQAGGKCREKELFIQSKSAEKSFIRLLLSTH